MDLARIGVYLVVSFHPATGWPANSLTLSFDTASAVLKRIERVSWEAYRVAGQCLRLVPQSFLLLVLILLLLSSLSASPSSALQYVGISMIAHGRTLVVIRVVAGYIAFYRQEITTFMLMLPLLRLPPASPPSARELSRVPVLHCPQCFMISIYM